MQREKMYRMVYAARKTQDQPTHPHILIRLPWLSKDQTARMCSMVWVFSEPTFHKIHKCYLTLSRRQIDDILVSILHKSIAGHYRPVRVADVPITVRCRFIKNASWDFFLFSQKTRCMECQILFPGKNKKKKKNKNVICWVLSVKPTYRWCLFSPEQGHSDWATRK